jgi:hypothetical protein
MAQLRKAMREKCMNVVFTTFVPHTTKPNNFSGEPHSFLKSRQRNIAYTEAPKRHVAGPVRWRCGTGILAAFSTESGVIILEQIQSIGMKGYNM